MKPILKMKIKARERKKRQHDRKSYGKEGGRA